MFQISEVDAADLSFDDEDFFDLNEPLSVGLKPASINKSEPALKGTTHQSSKTINKFSFKSKQVSPPTSDATSKLSTGSPTSLPSSGISPATLQSTFGVNCKDIHTKGNVSCAGTSALQRKSTLGNHNFSVAVSPSQHTPKSRKFCWNKSNANELDNNNVRRSSGGKHEQPSKHSRSALQILQKNLTCSNQHQAVISCQSNQSKMISNTMNNGPKTNRPGLRNTAISDRQVLIRNNNNNNNSNRSLQPSTCTNVLTGGHNISNHSSSSSKLSERRDVTANNFSRLSNSGTRTNANPQENPHSSNRVPVAYGTISHNQRPNFQPNVSSYTQRHGTPSNKHASPMLFQGSAASRSRDNVAKTPEPIYTAAQTPHFTPRVAEMCRTPKAVKVMEKTRLRKFPGPAGILPKLNLGNSEKQFDVIPPEPEETKDEKMAVASSQCTAVVDDFSSGAWKTMLRVLDIDANDPHSILNQNNIALVMRKASLKQLQQNKVVHLCVLLKNIHFNGSDASSILKDPTGEIQGTLHRKLMEDHKDELRPGCVLILRQVGVLSPSLRNHYLNITPSNLVHIFPMEAEASRQVEQCSKQPDSIKKKQQESTTDTKNLHLKEFFKQINHELTNEVHQQNTVMPKPKLLKTSQELASRSNLVKYDSLGDTGRAFKANCATINVTADKHKIKRSLQEEDKSAKRFCTANDTKHRNSSGTNNDLGENIEELLQGIEEELFDDF
ncbi:uncharacterized protein LOC117109117 [Anneissia japonica]|uniref:uncharacterized protein LOC117109117 n=1 Tax=Anneissia japonica TaxID=1529436 RepID=UPI00142585A7|nr:uncharacterized protein LOC117109117 [Anneissia japonica]